jgi:hypothetical protein
MAIKYLFVFIAHDKTKSQINKAIYLQRQGEASWESPTPGTETVTLDSHIPTIKGLCGDTAMLLQPITELDWMDLRPLFHQAQAELRYRPAETSYTYVVVFYPVDNSKSN